VAKLHFYYSTMNAGKSTTLLQSDYNYRERGMSTLLFAPKFDDRYVTGQITSRLGLSSEAMLYDVSTDLYSIIAAEIKNDHIHCVLIDEAQFLTRKQVLALTDVVDYLKIPVLAYGLRNDFKSEPFEGSKYLLTWSDQLIEIKTICHCGKKATHVLRLDANGFVIKDGSQIEIGGNDVYVAVCRKHFKEEVLE